MFESDKLIILNYPIGAGGKFLANCLGLAPNAVLQDRTLARQQLDGNLSPYDKFNLIMQRVSEVGKEWNDLELGCGKFFGDNCFFNRRSYTETDFYSEVSEVAKKNWYFFKVEHGLHNCNRVKRFFKNAKTMHFYSTTHNFFTIYRPDNGLDKYWHTVRADSWPANAPKSTTEVSKLAERIVDELVNKFENEIFQFVTNDVDPNGNLFWDTDWFLSEKDTVDNVEKFYNQLRLSDFNPEWIAVYRDAWLKKAGSVPLSKLVSAW